MTSVRGTSTRRRAVSWRVHPLIVAWLCLAVACTFVGESNPVAGVALLSVLTTALGAGAFWRHGGGRITATGVSMLAFAVFVGVAGIAAIADPKFVVDGWVWRAVLVTFVTKVIIYYGFTYYSVPEDTSADTFVIEPADPRVTAWGVTLGLLLLVGGVFVHPLGLGNPIVEAVPLVGALMVATALWRHRGGGLGAFRMLVVGGAFLAFALYIFDGLGRLNLAGLGLGIAIAASHRWKGRRLKTIILAALAPVLLYVSQMRNEYTASLNPAQGDDITGFESAIRPLMTLARLMEMRAEGTLDLAWGQTFYASSVALVPRELWADKPVGLGLEIAYLFTPWQAATGHTDLALIGGEWLWNFGFLGFVLMVPVMGLLLRLMDRGLVRVLSLPLDERRDLVRLVFMIVVVSGVVDLFWGGTFTYMSRAGVRMLVLAAIFVLAVRHRKQTPPQRPTSRPHTAPPMASTQAVPFHQIGLPRVVSK